MPWFKAAAAICASAVTTRIPFERHRFQTSAAST